MTQRERVASGTVSEPVRPVGGPVAARRSPTPETDPAPLASWEDLYSAASPLQQREMLSLAERQGVLYAHQIPATTNGTGSDPIRHFFGQLLLGRAEELETVRTGSAACIDAALDELQREAVGKALATPDVCLIQGLPGTGKSRVIAELVSRATLQGLKVLLLAQTPAALDRVLEEVGHRAGICAVRLLSREERPETLTPAIRDITFAERVRQLGDKAVAAARRQVEAEQQLLERCSKDEAVYDRFRGMAQEASEVQKQADRWAHERSQVASLVEQAAANESSEPFAAAIRERRVVLDAEKKRLETARSEAISQTAERQKELDALAPEITTVAPLAQAKQTGSLLSPSWWRATFAGDVVAKHRELEERQQKLRDALDELNRTVQRLDEETRQAEANFTTERTRLCETEINARLARIGESENELHGQQQALTNRWQALVAELAAESPRPTAPSDLAVDEALAAFRQLLEQVGERNRFAQEWLACLDASIGSFPERVANHANLVAATPAALSADGHFPAGKTAFDLLVYEEAHLWAETDFFALAPRARRWILIGEPDQIGANAATEASAGEQARKKPTRTAGGHRFFHRLWQQIHSDPRRLPYAWLRTNERWCCRLRVLSPEQCRQLESERVADCPEIELRILSVPRTPPTLAEVVFPPSMSLPQAKEYIFRELQELPVQAAGHCFTWLEEPERIVLRLAENSAKGLAPVMLDGGIREMLSSATTEANGSAAQAKPQAPLTCCLEFERRAGWDRARAEQWVQRHLGVRDLGRTARLDTLHRMTPELAGVVGNLLALKGYSPRPSKADGPGSHAHAPMEFIAVPNVPEEPASPKTENGKRNNGARTRPARAGGAGLELDLADPRLRERLPPAVRDSLPPHGLVNLVEAQAVIRLLEELAAQGTGTNGSPPRIGVVALYLGQAELIRSLAKLSPALNGIELRVGLSAAFAQRDCDIVVVSLTRSHTHRAVSYGDGPHALELALTRARSRIVFVGDPGTLVRRTQWDGTVDHLDEAASAREREVLTHLQRYLHGDGKHPRELRVSEGKSK